MKSELGCGGWMMFYYPREMMVHSRDRGAHGGRGGFRLSIRVTWHSLLGLSMVCVLIFLASHKSCLAASLLPAAPFTVEDLTHGQQSWLFRCECVALCSVISRAPFAKLRGENTICF